MCAWGIGAWGIGWAGCDGADPAAPAAEAAAEAATAADDVAGLDPRIYRQNPKLSDAQQQAAYRSLEIVGVSVSVGTARKGGDEAVVSVRNGTDYVLIGMDLELETQSKNGTVTEIASCFSSFEELVSPGEIGRFACGERSARLARGSRTEFETLGLHIPLEWNGRLIAQQLGFGTGAVRAY